MRVEIAAAVLERVERVVLVGDRLELDHGEVAAPRERAVLVQDIGDAAAHAGGEIAAGLAEHDDRAAGHVLAAMRADALDDRERARIAHGETLAGDAAEEAFAAHRAVEHRVADDDALVALERAVMRRVYDQPAAGQALAAIVVGGAFELERDAARQEGAEALPRRALEAHMDQAVGHSLVAITLRDFAREHGADDAMDVADRHLDGDRLLARQRRLRLGDELVVEGAVEAVVLLLALIGRRARRHGGAIEHARQVEEPRLRVIEAAPHLQLVGAPDHLVDRAEAEPRHVFAHFLGDEHEEIADVLGLADEAVAQLGILCRHPDRAGVEVALAHHDAAGGYQRGGGEAELVGAQQRADDDVATRAQAAIDLDRDAAAQAVEHQRLMRLGETDLPGLAGVMDRGEGAGARAALVAGNGDVVGIGLGDAGGDRADADLGDELDADPGLRVGVLEVVDELRQILDRVDVVMRRRRDQSHAGGGLAQPRDPLSDLVAGQLAAFAGLGALRHLDLQVAGVDEIFDVDAEAARGDLLDRRAHGIAVGQRLVALRVLAAL